MTNEDVTARAREIQKLIISASADVPPGLLWQQVLVACGPIEDPEFATIDFEMWSCIAGEQVEEIVSTQPLPDDLAFIYFGLYDSLAGGDSTDTARVGFYLAGGTTPNCEDAIENGDLSYFPARRRLHLDILDRLREEGRKKPDQQRVFEWLLLLAAAAVLAKSALTMVGVQVPTFVGPDSGDYFQVRE